MNDIIVGGLYRYKEAEVLGDRIIKVIGLYEAAPDWVIVKFQYQDRSGRKSQMGTKIFNTVWELLEE